MSLMNAFNSKEQPHPDSVEAPRAIQSEVGRLAADRLSGLATAYERTLPLWAQLEQQGIATAPFIPYPETTAAITMAAPIVAEAVQPHYDAVAEATAIARQAAGDELLDDHLAYAKADMGDISSQHESEAVASTQQELADAARAQVNGINSEVFFHDQFGIQRRDVPAVAEAPQQTPRSEMDIPVEATMRGPEVDPTIHYINDLHQENGLDQDAIRASIREAYGA